MRVLVTGNRHLTDQGLVWRDLAKLYCLFAAQGLTVIHGDCPTGADHHADQWGRRAAALGLNVAVERYPARFFRPVALGRADAQPLDDPQHLRSARAGLSGRRVGRYPRVHGVRSPARNTDGEQHP